MSEIRIRIRTLKKNFVQGWPDWRRVQQTICLHFVLYKAGSNQKDAKITLIHSSKRSGISVWYSWKTFFLNSETTVWSICVVHNDGSGIMYCLLNRGYYSAMLTKDSDPAPFMIRIRIYNTQKITLLRGVCAFAILRYRSKLQSCYGTGFEGEQTKKIRIRNCNEHIYI